MPRYKDFFRKKSKKDNACTETCQPTTEASAPKKRKGNTTPVSDQEEPIDSNWNLTIDLWPLERRTPIYRNKEVVNKMDRNHLLKIIDLHKDEEKMKDKRASAGGARADEKIPLTRYEAQDDDRKNQLHAASLLRLPVAEPESWYSQVPLTRTECVKSIPLKATGSEHSVSDVAIERLHNRASNLSLKFFVAENISVSSKPPRETRKYGDEGLSTTTELAWEQAATISQATDAVISYGCLLQQLWPTDTTGWALIRLYNRYKWLISVQPTKTRVDLIATTFNRILKKNSLKAANKEAPIQYEEMEKILKNTLIRNNQKPDVPVPGEKNASQEQKFNLRKQGPRYQGAQSQPQYGSQPQQQQAQLQAAYKIPQAPTANGLKLCFGFNNPGQQCSYTPQAGGSACKGPRGTTFAHACSNWIQSKNRYCLQAGHGKRDCRNK